MTTVAPIALSISTDVPRRPDRQLVQRESFNVADGSSDPYSKIFNKYNFSTADVQASKAVQKSAQKDEGFSFLDFLDVINPLQHIPVIGALYREITGDEIKPAAQLLGGGIFGGPIGLALAGADVAVEQTSGQSISDHTMAFFRDENKVGDVQRGYASRQLDQRDDGFVSERGLLASDTDRPTAPLFAGGSAVNRARAHMLAASDPYEILYGRMVG